MPEKKKSAFSIADYAMDSDVSKLDTPPASAQVVEIPLDQICANDKNFYDTSNVDELVKSIELNGLIEPIIVKPVILPTGKTIYQIISGHRRFKAFQELNAGSMGQICKARATSPAATKRPPHRRTALSRSRPISSPIPQSSPLISGPSTANQNP